MKNKKLILLLPIAPFVILPIPYCFAFDMFFINWFGCGCTEGFNANHFSQVFWAVIALLCMAAAPFTSRVLDRRLYKVCYIVGVVAVCVIMFYLCSHMIIAK